MTVILDGNCIYPIRDYEMNIPLEIQDLPISENAKNAIINWTNEYCRFTALTIAELIPLSHTIDGLDMEGKKLLRMLSEEWNVDGVEKFYYFSLCKDRLLLVIHKDGKALNFT